MVTVVTTEKHRFSDNAMHILLLASKESGETAQVMMDNASHGMIAISHEHHEIHAGDAFRYNDSLTLASGVSQDYLLTVANTTKWPHFTFSADGTAVTTTEVFRATDKTGTTLQSTFNANENSATVAGLTIHKGTSGGTTDGVSIFKYSSGTATGMSTFTGVEVFSGERILRQNTKYIIRITSGTNGNLVNLRADWYEHTSEA